MTATANQGMAGNSRTVRAGVPRVVGGRGWQGGEKREGTAWRPAVDISERRDAYLVTVEVPGIKAGQVEISIANDLLTIQGERYDAREAAGEKIHRSERGYGVFRRSLALPSSHVDANKTEASVRDGVLEILIPKAAGPQDTLIPVLATQVTTFLAPVVTRDDRPC